MTEGRLSRFGGKLAARGPLWAGSVCWSSAWVCLNADRWGREGETYMKMRLTCLPPIRWNSQRGGEQWSEAESHRLCKGTMRKRSLHKGESLNEWETQMGRKKGGESDRAREGKLSAFPHLPSLPPRLCWQRHALVKRDYQSPARGCMYGHSHYLCPANKWHCCLNTNQWLSDPPLIEELLSLDLAGKM